MSKIIKCILGCMLVFMVSGCNVNKESEDDRNNFKDSEIFKTIAVDRNGNGSFTIVYHMETKVMYVVYVEIGNSSRGVGITPLLNPDGTPMLYQGE